MPTPTIDATTRTVPDLSDDMVEAVLRRLEFDVTGPRTPGFRMANNGPIISCTTTCSCASPRRPK